MSTLPVPTVGSCAAPYLGEELAYENMGWLYYINSSIAYKAKKSVQCRQNTKQMTSRNMTSGNDEAML